VRIAKPAIEVLNLVVVQQGVNGMKVLIGILGTLSFLAGATTALSDVPCEKCTHEMQVKYRECLRSGKTQAACSEEQQKAALACVQICSKGKESN
jgi:hypothetical protein